MNRRELEALDKWIQDEPEDYPIYVPALKVCPRCGNMSDDEELSYFGGKCYRCAKELGEAED